MVPPGLSPLVDAKALLSFAWQGGFLKSALLGLGRTAFSDYRKIRDEIGLAQYGEAEMLEILDEAGFSAERSARNLGHNQARMTFVARPLEPKEARLAVIPGRVASPEPRTPRFKTVPTDLLIRRRQRVRVPGSATRPGMTAAHANVHALWAIKLHSITIPVVTTCAGR